MAIALAASADKVAIHFSPKIGDEIWYRITMAGTTELSGSAVSPPGGAPPPGGGQPIPVQIAIVFSVEVTSKDKDSNWVIEQKVRDVEMTAMGIDMSQALAGAVGVPITITQDEFGNILKLEGLPAIGGGGPMNPAGFSAVTLAPRMLSFPDGEIEVGESWEPQSSEAAKQRLGQSKAELRATLVSIEEIDGQECAKIKVVSNAAPELEGAFLGSDSTTSVKAESESVYVVRISDGKILTMDGKMKTQISAGEGGGLGAKNDMTMSMVEIPPQKETGPASEPESGTGG